MKHPVETTEISNSFQSDFGKVQSTAAFLLTLRDGMRKAMKIYHKINEYETIDHFILLAKHQKMKFPTTPSKLFAAALQIGTNVCKLKIEINTFTNVFGCTEG